MILKFFSLRIKFSLIAVSIGVVSFGVAAILANQWTALELKKSYEEKAILVGTHIIHDLEGVMVSKLHENISDVLNIYRTKEEIKELKVFNLKGEEAFTQEKGALEAGVEEALKAGKLVSSHKELNRKEVASFILPIKNKRDCHACHGEKGELRGALLVSFSLEEMEGNIARQRIRFFILFSIIAFGIVVATVFAVNRLFIKPLSHIQKGTEAIGKGHFEYEISSKSKDEIGALAENFNQMARTLYEKNETLWDQFRLLSRSYKEWQETFDTITDLIAVIDKNCKIIRANRAFHNYFSISPYDEINKKCSELFGYCLNPDCPHQTESREKTPVFSEFHDLHTGKILEVSLFHYFSPDSQTSSSVLIAKDITEKKENEMRQILNERLAALGQMASGIAHEINTPLATISACTEGLIHRMEKGQLDAPLFESYLKIIEDEISRCKTITTSMLSFVRKTKSEGKEVDIHEALDKTLELIGFQRRLNEVEILKNYHGEIPMIHGNEGELIQVFLSILLNALDAMGNKGKLTLETNMDKENILINISDTGPGIPANLINRIFDPFFTTKHEQGGTGLGLSIAKKIVEEKNGKVSVTSQEKKGTTFTIILPIEYPNHLA
jgi:PAS domain S-box-containing protein